MRSTIVVLALVGALALTGCTGGAEPPALPGSQTLEAPGGGDSPSTSEPVAADCSGVTDEELQQWGLYIQILAQLSEANIDSVLDGTLPLDLDAFDATTDALRTLEGVDSGGLGDVGEALDYYDSLSDAARVLLAKGEGATADDFATYEQASGGISAVIGNQMPLAAAYDVAC